MNIHYIGFIPPVVGIEGVFNTFRLGGLYRRILTLDEIVYLSDEKNRVVFGSARVTRILSATLMEACVLYGADNHTQLVRQIDDESSGAGVFKIMQKIYGPHIATPNKLTTVIYLDRGKSDAPVDH